MPSTGARTLVNLLENDDRLNGRATNKKSDVYTCTHALCLQRPKSPPDEAMTDLAGSI